MKTTLARRRGDAEKKYKRPKALDLFCGAGGASMGLHRAGCDVTGVDIRPQPHYPFDFIQGDALEQSLDGYDFVWASPPCQTYYQIRGLLVSQGRAKDHPALIEETRAKLQLWGGDWIIENVVGAPLIDPVMLCGSSFGLLVQRHRLFESNVMMLGLPCAHSLQLHDKPCLHRHNKGKSRVVGCYGSGRGKGDNMALWSEAMGIDWMTRKECAQAIPPAYSEFLFRQILQTARRAA